MNKINYINDNIAQGLLANEIVVIGAHEDFISFSGSAAPSAMTMVII